jgi:hypothetical protein
MELPLNWEKTYTIRAKALHHAEPDTYVIWLISPENVNILAYQDMSGMVEMAEYQPISDEEAGITFIYQAFGVSV